MNYLLRFVPRSGSIMVDAFYRTQAAAELAHKQALEHATTGKPLALKDDFGQVLTIFTVNAYAIQFTSTAISASIQASFAPPPSSQLREWPKSAGSSVQ